MARTPSLRRKLYNIIFTTNGRAAYLFDVWLLIFILISAVGIMLESVPTINDEYGTYLKFAEWFFTICFTIEYLLRIYSAKKRFKYVTSGWGLVDLLAILPSYLGLFLSPTMHYLIALRVLRLIRVFRVFKLKKYVTGGNIMMIALEKSRPKIISFVLFVILVSVVLGSLMYIVEGQGPGFETIPDSIYWAIITLTTVGYGTVVPATVLGKMIATCIMILGYGIIAVPTGIVSAEMVKEKDSKGKQ